VKIVDFIYSSGIDKTEARILLEHHLGYTKDYLILHDSDEITITKEMQEDIKRVKKSEPIEYITQKVSFYSQEFIITSGVLIPRPETELLIDKVVKVAQDMQDLNIAEIGVGSAVISIMLSKLLPNISYIVASDINPQAIELSSKNIKLHGIENIELIHTSLLDKVDKKIDIIVSNPPYIADDYMIQNNLRYEPSNALFGGKIGDEILKQIIDLAFEKDIKYLLCEMGYDQKDKITNYLKDKEYKNLEFYQDYSGFDRGFIMIKTTPKISSFNLFLYSILFEVCEFLS